MKARKVQVKVFAKDAGAVRPGALVPVFHEWIKQGALGELMIDVADYEHVDQGPAVMLVGHESDYWLDLSEGKPGLAYSRKRGGPDGGEALLVDALRRVLLACKKLEDEASLSPRLGFAADRIEIKLNDRVAAPNTAETYAEAQATLDAAFGKVFGPGGYSCARVDNDPRELLTVEVRVPGAPRVGDLAARVS